MSAIKDKAYKRTKEDFELERAFNTNYKGLFRFHPYFETLAPYIVDNFCKFHAENPKVYALYVEYANELYSRNRTNYGSHAIIERIRWHTSVETKGDEDFKISNNHQVCYCRLLMIRDSKFVGFFRIQGLRPFWKDGLSG